MRNKGKRLTERKSLFVFSTMILATILVCIFFMGMSPSGKTIIPLGLSAENEVNIITIEKPAGWKTKETAVKITVTVPVQKVQAKIGEKGSFQDITDDMTWEKEVRNGRCPEPLICG